ncbi:TMEM175 family protein [Streptococcus henryi]|uniref:TMEM175 family protein n=1 Tax=Streptococcus henryi TaxID=439219 RepID=UPI00036E1CE9|nr:TMEM175 family protein [Streptococcus henryi]
MKKLLERFDILSDAIIAIIMTILVLEIEAPTNSTELFNFFKEISLFLVSFMLLINIWYRRTKIVLRTEITKLESLLFDVIAHALMSLFPLAVKTLVAYEDEWLSVLFFGLLNMLVITLINMIPVIEMGHNWEKGQLSGYIHQFFRRRVWLTILFNLAAIAIAYFLGHYGTYFYLILPFADFLANYHKDRQIKDVLNDESDFRSILAEKLGLN